MKKSFLVTLLLAVVSSGKAFGQFTGIDKARIMIYSATTDAEKLEALTAMNKFKNSLPFDSIYHYAHLMKSLAFALKDNRSLARAEYSLLSGDMVKGKTDSLVHKIETTPVFKDIKNADKALYYKIQLLKANTLNRLNNRTAALDLQLKLLNEATADNDVNTQLFILNYIGATYLNVGRAADAKQNWLQALDIIAEKNDRTNDEIEAYILSNLALYYFNSYEVRQTKQLSDSFLTTVNKTIEVSTRCEAMGVLAAALSLRGNFYGIIKSFDAGEQDIQQGLSIRKRIGDPLYILNDFVGLASFYFNQKAYDKTVETATEGIALAKRNHISGEHIPLIGLLAAAQKAAGNYKQYGDALELYIAAADSNNRVNSAEKIAAIQTRYEVQKKETLIAQQKLELFQRKLWLFGGALLSVVMLLYSAYRFRLYKKEEKIKSQLAVKDAEENERRRIAAELHDNLGVQANAILHNSSLLNTERPGNKVVADLQETAKEMLLNLRETLWAMRSTDVMANDLWLRIINFMKQMGRHYTTINFKVDGEVPGNFVLHSNRALNIVLVVQETVNNAVKHAGAATITTDSKWSDSEWQIKITDDGKGFNLEEAAHKNDSYGLHNMKERAAAGNFSFMVKTEPGKGTQVLIIVS